jgi:hypothetical protein
MMEIEHHRIIDAAIYASFIDHIFAEKCSDCFTAGFIALGLSLLRLALI